MVFIKTKKGAKLVKAIGKKKASKLAQGRIKYLKNKVKARKVPAKAYTIAAKIKKNNGSPQIIIKHLSKLIKGSD